jgi:thiol-disulfide isomerase/thioredoxin
MNKKIIFYLFISLAAVSCKQNTVNISGTIVNPVNGTYIILDELKSNDLKAVDSVKVSEDGKFTFKREIKHPSFYLIKTNNNNYLTMLVAPGEKISMQVHGDSLSNPISLEGSAGTESMIGYNKTLKATIKKMSGLNATYQENLNNPQLSKVIESLDSLANVYLDEINAYTKKYIDDNITSLVSLVALYQQVAPRVSVLNPEKDIKYFVKVDSSMFSLYPDYEPVATLHEQVKGLTSKVTEAKTESESAPGALATDISLPTPQGDTIKLSSTRGSVVLLDFWASWCAPCRKENPNLVNAYKTYHNKGFQIYQVSLDKTKDAWMKGIEEDHLDKWIHVSDVKFWNSIVVGLYKIESIPCNYLLDKEGHIIASNLRGEQLQKKLAEIFR